MLTDLFKNQEDPYAFAIISRTGPFHWKTPPSHSAPDTRPAVPAPAIESNFEQSF